MSSPNKLAGSGSMDLSSDNVTPTLPLFDFNLPACSILTGSKPHAKVCKNILAKVNKAREMEKASYSRDDKIIANRSKALRRDLEKSGEKEVQMKIKDKRQENKAALKKDDKGSVSAAMLDVQLAEYELKLRDELLDSSNAQLSEVRNERVQLLKDSLRQMKESDLSLFREYKLEALELVRQKQQLDISKVREQHDKQLKSITKRVKNIKNVSDLPAIMADKQEITKRQEEELNEIKDRHQADFAPIEAAWSSFEQDIESFYSNAAELVV